MSTSTVNTTGTDEQEDVSLAAKKEFLHYRNIQSQVVRSMTSSLRMYTDLDAREHMKGLDDEGAWRARGKIRFEDRVDDAKENISTYLPELRRSLAHMEADFVAKMAKAKQWIGNESYERWIARLTDPRVSHWEKQKFLTKTFPAWFENWEAYGKTMDSVKDLQKQHHLRESDIKNFSKLKTAKFPEKRVLAQQILEEVKKQVNSMGSAERDARSLLTHAVTAKALSPGKVDGWIAHIFSKYKGAAAERFVEKTLPKFIEDWKDVANEFRHHLPRCLRKGIDAPTESEFLSLTYEQRREKVTEMRAGLSGNSVEAEKGKSAGYLKMRIRFALATDDAEGATELVDQLAAEHPEDGDLSSLEKQAAMLSKKAGTARQAAETPSLNDLQRQIWGHLDRMGDHNMRRLLERAMTSQDLDVIEGVMQMIYNRHWCRSHGYLNDELEQREAKNETNKEKTKEYAENGHSRSIERNIIAGETAEAASIRGQNSKAQLLFLSNEDAAHEAMVKKVEQHKYQKNAGLRYWGTIVTTDTQQNVNAFDHTKTFVESIYYPMRSALRQFMRRGGKYQRKGAALN